MVKVLNEKRNRLVCEYDTRLAFSRTKPQVSHLFAKKEQPRERENFIFDGEKQHDNVEIKNENIFSLSISKKKEQLYLFSSERQ